MQIKVHDLETNSEIQREMNAEELATYQTIINDNNKQAAEAAAKAAARLVAEQKLAAIGLTKEDLTALGL